MTDTINGFRAIKRRCVLEMELEPTGFDIEFQMSIRGRKLGYRIVEIPTREGDRIGGESTAYSIPTGMLMLKRYVKELVSGVITPDQLLGFYDAVRSGKRRMAQPLIDWEG